MTLNDKANYIQSISDVTMPYEASMMFAKEIKDEPATEKQIRYLSCLGHIKHSTAPAYFKWQERIKERYSLWSFSDITNIQASLEIKKLL
jgi:hypothetical protein